MPPVCHKCGKPEPGAQVCSSCFGKHTFLDGVRSVFRFDGAIKQGIYDLKYHQFKVIAAELSRLLADYLSSNPIPGEVFVPVPLHSRRMRERGYNQSGLVAHELSKLVNLPVVEGSLIRVKNSSPQARSISAEQRRINVIDAFFCKDDRLKNKHVILIDDVCTSGATLESCAGAAKRGGAITVWGLTLAREI